MQGFQGEATYFRVLPGTTLLQEKIIIWQKYLYKQGRELLPKSASKAATRKAELTITYVL